jgi:hypothetical protein
MAGHAYVPGVELDSHTYRPSGDGALNWTHWMNLLAFLTSATVAYLDYMGVFGERSADLDTKYQTLITPATWTSLIWCAIYAGEGTFALAQLWVPRFRSSAVVEAVTQMWILTCASQILWFVLYSQELLAMSFAIAAVLAATLLLLIGRADAEDMTSAEFWLLRAPFSLHAGWAIVLSGQNLNVVADALLFQPDTLLALAYATLIAVMSIGVGYQLFASRPDAIIVGVMFWAFGGIWSELCDPARLDSPDRWNSYMWDRSTLENLQWTSLGCACCTILAEAVAAAKRASAPALKLGGGELFN